MFDSRDRSPITPTNFGLPVTHGDRSHDRDATKAEGANKSSNFASDITVELTNSSGTKLPNNSQISDDSDEPLDPTVPTRVLADSPSQLTCQYESGGNEHCGNEQGGETVLLNNDSELPRDFKVGRYVIVKSLGRGGFGTVYLAWDAELTRNVAIKIPHRSYEPNKFEQETFLSEAKTLAGLDHPRIVPVYDSGLMPDGRCFSVYKFIKGQDLAQAINSGLIDLQKAVRMLADVADALDHVHQAGLVHRDIKPGNLLLSDEDQIFLADFGLAFRESQRQTGYFLAGTPDYMSPEQARGEGHRVDARSDLFSLGAVMYELITGERPFLDPDKKAILNRVISFDPVPPRSVNSRVPGELNRICLKLLSKQAADRYSTAKELGEDLISWLDSVTRVDSQSATVIQQSPRIADTGMSQSISIPQIVPRGLRPFLGDDADFFISLLPGVRDRNGLPLILSHWKRWVSPHQDDPVPHRVGVIMGPTGSGKSSLVRAGLIPILGPSVVKVFVEATPDMTERQLSAAIKRKSSETVANSLPEWIAAIRRGNVLPPDKTLLIVIDQFEQWLHANPQPGNSELVRAIRQCDGTRVQCIILVREDFSNGICRFFKAIELPLLFDTNATTVEPFDVPHARKVLIKFGRAFDRLPLSPEPLSREQDQFVDTALSHLIKDEKVFPVQLALFAEMMKSRDWLPSTLERLGGAVGVGEQFLSESFSLSHAPSRRRKHETAARNVLKAMLPPRGTEIKSSRCPRSKLMIVSGYKEQWENFNLLMEILETDLKLITLVDTEDELSGEVKNSTVEDGDYQLSHDFLVPSVRQWISNKQRESYRGRLHLKISDRAELWGETRDSRYLPSFFEWAQARFLLARRSLTPTESKMLSAKDTSSIFSFIASCLIASAFIFGFLQHKWQLKTFALVEQLKTSGLQMVPGVISQLATRRRFAEPILKRAIDEASAGSRERFVLQVASLPWSADGVDEVFQQILSCSNDIDCIDNVSLAAEYLRSSSQELVPRCWAKLESKPDKTTASKERRLCAAQLLVAMAPSISADDERKWAVVAPELTESLIETCMKHPDHFGSLERSLRPISKFLVPHLTKFLGTNSEDGRSGFGFALLDSYTRGDPDLRTSLFLLGSGLQQEILLTNTEPLSTKCLWDTVRGAPVVNGIEVSQERHAHRVAVAAAMLLLMPENQNSPELWNLLKRVPDPTVRTTLIHELRPKGVPLSLLAIRLVAETDPGISCAILQAIGEFDSIDAIGPRMRQELHDHVRYLFLKHRDSGVHSSAEWLLKRWKDFEMIDSLPVTPKPVFLGHEPNPNDWIKSPEGHVFALFRGLDVPEVNRELLISTKEVTIEQIRKFDPGAYVNRDFAGTDDCPAHVVFWRAAHAYCNWLSEKEGLPPCYPTNPSYPDNWDPKEEHLSQTGYRLPVIKEWQAACRSGTTTALFLGQNSDFLDQYCWSDANSGVRLPNGSIRLMSHPVGLLKPNELGLFDTLGSVMEWSDNREFDSERWLCGGSIKYSRSMIRVDACEHLFPGVRYNTAGFRIVRTIR